MLKISKQELSEFWKSVENIKVVNPETKNEVKLKSLKPEQFESHKKILKQYWDKWEKSTKKEDKNSQKPKENKLDDFKVDYKNELENEEELINNKESYKREFITSTPKGSKLIGTKHLDEDSEKWVKEFLVPEIKSFLSDAKKEGKQVVFLGEGGLGSDDENKNYLPGTEQELVAKMVNKSGGQIDTWDGEDTNLGSSDSLMAKELNKRLGVTEGQRMAYLLALNIGHSSGSKEDIDNEMDWFSNDLNKESQEEGIKFLKDNGYKGKFPPESEEDSKELYDLTFPRDKGLKEQKISQISDTYNEIRGQNMLKKIKDYEDKGIKVLVTPGASHVPALKGNFESKTINKKSSLDFEDIKFY